MSHEIRWDKDPTPDASLARLLRAGGAAVPESAVDWEGLCQAVMDRVGVESAGRYGWLEVVARWGPPAMAASLVAMLLSGFFWQALTQTAEPEIASAAPESVAVARAASAYPDEPAFASLVRTEHHDEFTAWGIR
ncbi:MAG TPA: hypothetical protein VIG08_01415 [Gemmatimonadales bacterium]|jgi:hypothetical protein